MTVSSCYSALANSCLAIVAPSAYLLGGVQTWLDYLVPGLESRGWDVTVVLVHGVHSDAHRYIKAHPFSKVRVVSNLSGSREGRARALAAEISAINPSLVLGVNIVDVYDAMHRVRELGRSSRIVMALHGLQSCFYEDLATFRDVIDGVIATNLLGAAAAIKLSGAEPTRVCYAPCGVDIPEVPPSIFISGKLTLLFAGRFDELDKRVMDLPGILAALERRQIVYHMRLAGSGPAESRLRTALESFGDKVEFLGVLDQAALRASFFSEGAVLLITSPSETGPLVAWEAMASGAALVTSCFVGIGLEGSLRHEENCLIFPVGDVDMAAAEIAKLVDPTFRRRLSEAGHELVRGRYSRARSVEAWDFALRRFLECPPLRRLSSSASSGCAVAGRLDFFLGPRKAETLRRLLNIRYCHKDAGDEWPHSYGGNQNKDFYSQLSAIDKNIDINETKAAAIGTYENVSTKRPFITNVGFPVRVKKKIKQARALAGVILKERWLYERILAASGTSYLKLCNRNEHLEVGPDGGGYRCHWQWTSDLHAPKVLPALGLRLMRRALGDHPIARASSAPARAGRAPDLTFLIGHRGMERLPHLLATLDSIAAQRGVAVECIVVEQDAVSQLGQRLPSWVRLVHTPPPESDMPYCRSWAFNVGARHALGAVLVLHDNDLLVPEDYAAQVLSRVAQGYQVVNLKRFIFYLTQAQTQAVLKGRSSLLDSAPEVIVQNTEGGGSVAITRAGYEKIGGLDESFIGWGGEDNEFWERAQTLRVWPWGNLSLVHLWHAAQVGKHDPRFPTAGQYRRLSRVDPQERIRRLCSSARGQMSGPLGWPQPGAATGVPVNEDSG